MKTNKKGVINQLMPVIISLVGIAIVLVVGFLIMAEARTQIGVIEGTDCDTSTSSACNGTEAVQEAMADIPGWLPIIVITIIGALLLGLVTLFRQSGQ